MQHTCALNYRRGGSRSSNKKTHPRLVWYLLYCYILFWALWVTLCVRRLWHNVAVSTQIGNDVTVTFSWPAFLCKRPLNPAVTCFPSAPFFSSFCLIGRFTERQVDRTSPLDGGQVGGLKADWWKAWYGRARHGMAWRPRDVHVAWSNPPCSLWPPPLTPPPSKHTVTLTQSECNWRATLRPKERVPRACFHSKV